MRHQPKLLPIVLAIIAGFVLTFLTAPPLVARFRLNARLKLCHNFCDDLRRRLAPMPELFHVGAATITDGHVSIGGHVPAESESKLLAAINESHRIYPVRISVQAEGDHALLYGQANAGEELTIDRLSLDTLNTSSLK